MIAYNHCINFVPELKNDKNVEDSFANVITVQQSTHNDLHDNFISMMTFYNSQGRDLTLYTDREVARTQSGQLWAFEVKDVVTFFWQSGTSTLEYLSHKKFTLTLLEYWCLHLVLPIFFTIEEKYFFLHAGAVEVSEKPILFVAESFGGKSTMIDFFIRQGHKMISDDKVATFEKEGVFLAVSAHPYHRPYRKMEELGMLVEKFSSSMKPINAIYKLERADADAKVDVRSMHGGNKFIALRYASEINMFFQKSLRFDYLMKMARNLPVFQVAVPWDMDRLSEVHQAVIEHNQNL